MIVADASAVLEVVLRTATGIAFGTRLLDPKVTVLAPHLLDVEVAQVLRRFERSGQLDGRRGAEALDDLVALPIDRYPHELLLQRVWELRQNLTAYDAVYVALAEAVDAPLVTCDRRLVAAPGHRATIQLLTP